MQFHRVILISHQEVIWYRDQPIYIADIDSIEIDGTGKITKILCKCDHCGHKWEIQIDQDE